MATTGSFTTFSGGIAQIGKTVSDLAGRLSQQGSDLLTHTYGVGGMKGGTYTAAKSSNPDYQGHLKCQAAGFEIIYDLPEQLNSSIASDYEAVLAGIGDGSNAISAGVAYVVGSSVTFGFQTYQVWKASSPIEFSQTILFDATSDAKKEVYTPMRLLEALALPKTGGSSNSGVLIAPNFNMPTVITLGRMLNALEVLLISVNNTFDTRLDKNGYPISGQSEISLRTPKAYSREEWMALCGI